MQQANMPLALPLNTKMINGSRVLHSPASCNEIGHKRKGPSWWLSPDFGMLSPKSTLSMWRHLLEPMQTGKAHQAVILPKTWKRYFKNTTSKVPPLPWLVAMLVGGLRVKVF